MNLDKKLAPTIFVIFGITGDLSRKKLIPALLDLYAKKKLPEQFMVWGFSRKPFSDEGFRIFLREALERKGHSHSDEVVSSFLHSVHYHQGTFDESACYAELEDVLQKQDKAYGTCSNKLFYLAVPPAQYETILTKLAHSNLTIPCGGDDGWTRVLIEKPFGRDVKTARKLDRLLGKLFNEKQIFRIDHYLAKETLQNILAFRFANGVFEPVWNRRHIESVTIRMHENNDVATRGAFYDDIGALRDIGQNHMLQMLAVIAMDECELYEEGAIRSRRAEVFRKLEIKNISESVRAQYEGYRDTEGVREGSQTETFFRLTAFVNTHRFKGVPFLLEGGKALSRSFAEIDIHFKNSPATHFQIPEGVGNCRNTLTFRVQPNESIELVFWAKKAGLSKELERKTFTFNYAEQMQGQADAYEKVLLDAVHGDQTLFASTDEVLYSWKFITPILEKWSHLPLQVYKQGSDGSELKSN
ncbi:MAG: glucose-6-phosphate dehydrogenase [Candidatus Paceibacterota bacterium]